MPAPARERAEAPRLEQLRRIFHDKHLPGCYHRDLPLERCVCGGPEREMLLRALAENESALS